MAQDKLKSNKKHIRSLQVKLTKATAQQKVGKKQVQREYQWNGEESTFTDNFTQFYKVFLFPQCNFLRDGWHELAVTFMCLREQIMRIAG